MASKLYYKNESILETQMFSAMKGIYENFYVKIGNNAKNDFLILMVLAPVFLSSHKGMLFNSALYCTGKNATDSIGELLSAIQNLTEIENYQKFMELRMLFLLIDKRLENYAKNNGLDVWSKSSKEILRFIKDYDQKYRKKIDEGNHILNIFRKLPRENINIKGFGEIVFRNISVENADKILIFDLKEICVYKESMKTKGLIRIDISSE